MSIENIKSRFPFRFSLAYSLLFLVLYWPGVLLLPYRGFFHHMEDLWQDQLFRSNESRLAQGDARIILAAMDDDTGKKLGFPLPRGAHARLLDKLKGYGVKTVVFDVMFFEPREGDAELAAATKRFGRVIHLFTTESKETPVGEVVTVNPPVKALGAAAQFLGYPNVDHVIDEDGHIRRVMVFDPRAHNPRVPEEMAQSMDVAGLRSYIDRDYAALVGDYFLDPEPRILLLNFRKPRIWYKHEKASLPLIGKIADLPMVESPYRTLSVMDLLSGELTPDQKKALKGSLVIVGSTALGYFDHYPTPFTPQAPGAEYHANIMDNMVTGDFMRPVSRGWVLLVILFMVWLPMLLLRLPPAAGAGVVAGVFFLWGGLSEWLFTRGVRIETVSPLTALLSSFLVQTVHRVLAEGHEKRRIKGLFGQFVAPEVVEDLAKNPEKARLGGEKREMTMLFLDIAHFTTISEKLPAEQLILFLNKYLSALSQVVQEHKAVVGNYIGDCIMAFWNSPVLPLEDHRAQACLAAIECQKMMAVLNASLDSKLPLPEVPSIRIGLNSGSVTVGMTGSEKKLQYTTLGDEVNLASRLEGANKFFGSRIMVSEATFDGAKHVVEARELGRVRVVGKETPIRVFELLGKKGDLSPDWRKALPHYERGLGLFHKRDYKGAVLAFSEVLKVFPEDGPGALYLNASRDYSAIPPPADWDGVFNLTAK